MPTEEQITIIADLVGRMSGLGITARPQSPIDGPVVTAYPFILPDNVPLSKLINREEDLALAVGAEKLDIQRVGGQVIIFVPNKERRTIGFNDSLFHFLRNKEVETCPIPINLGMDFRGSPAYLDLTSQPHCLIAGSTGSGKSVFESEIVASLAMAKTPSELQIYLVDTKRVDLTLFKDLPHVQDLVKEVKDWYRVWNTLWREYKHRMELFENLMVRNIREYNNLQPPDKKLPHILLMIDELADLINHDQAFREDAKLAAKNEEGEEHDEPKVMDAIKRLLGVCRASGIHAIICTQRTSVDIISGVVKANIPCRISLRLPTGTDSRTILGVNGAENLLGKGDMLVKYQDIDEPKRYHGPFVRLEDVAAVLSDRERIREMIGAI